MEIASQRALAMTCRRVIIVTTKYYLRGRVQFPIGGTARERASAGFGGTPGPTVTVWIEEGYRLNVSLI
jgi:hypothetical protein